MMSSVAPLVAFALPLVSEAAPKATTRTFDGSRATRDAPTL